MKNITVRGAARLLYYSSIAILWMMIVFPSCTTPVVKKIQRPYTDIELRPYVEAFLAKCDQYNKDCSSIYDYRIVNGEIADSRLLNLFGISLSEDTIGTCEAAFLRITIKAKYFNKKNDIQRELLLAHELGHCILNKEHTEHDSIMSPVILFPGNYMRNYQKYYNELFDCKNSCPELQFEEERYVL